MVKIMEFEQDLITNIRVQPVRDKGWAPLKTDRDVVDNLTVCFINLQRNRLIHTAIWSGGGLLGSFRLLKYLLHSCCKRAKSKGKRQDTLYNHAYIRWVNSYWTHILGRTRSDIIYSWYILSDTIFPQRHIFPQKTAPQDAKPLPLRPGHSLLGHHCRFVPGHSLLGQNSPTYPSHRRSSRICPSIHLGKASGLQHSVPGPPVLCYNYQKSAITSIRDLLPRLGS